MLGSRDEDSLGHQLTRGAPLALVLAAIAYVLYRLVLVLEVVAVAVLLAIVLRTSLRWIRKIVRVRWLAVLILIGLILGFGVFIALVLIPNFISESQILVSKLPDYANRLRELAFNLHSRWSFIPNISTGVDRLRSYIGGLLTSFPLVLKNSFGGVIEVIGTVILALYMAYDPNSVIRGVLRLVPHQHHDKFKIEPHPAIELREFRRLSCEQLFARNLESQLSG